ncbi:unnamed protein product [Peniophora sp. CBMAI 1063]|nr:unnamed protein product [Peniophora sp. CBMAI 1063]
MLTGSRSDCSPTLPGLPNELTAEIAVWGQRTWLEERCNARAVIIETDRLTPVVVDQYDCRGVTAGVVKGCLADGPLLPQQPAHALMHTSSGLSRALRDVKSVWERTANTLVHAVACMAGKRAVPPPALMSAGARFSYQTDVLVAENVCSCIIAGIQAFYPTLRIVKLSLPWAYVSELGKTSVSTFFRDHHSQDASPLEYFDVVLHDDVHHNSEFLSPYRSPSLRSCRVGRTSFFFYGPLLETLNIAFSFGSNNYLGPSFLNALIHCVQLQFLTLDGGSCEIIESAMGDEFYDEMPNVVSLPSLRYLRLVLRADVGTLLLGRLDLPADIDAHLEPVTAWRAAAEHKEEVNFSSVPGAAMLWQYAMSLGASACTPTIFNHPAQFALPPDGLEEDIIRALSTAVIKIVIDPVSLRSVNESDMFPESITFMLAAGIQDANEILRDATQPSTPSLPGEGKILLRQSLTVRDAAVAAHDRDPRVHRWPLGLGNMLIQHIADVLVSGYGRTSQRGLSNITNIIVDGTLWMSQTCSDWAKILNPFDNAVHLTICRHGHINVEALVVYLQSQDGAHRLPRLQTIDLPLSERGTANGTQSYVRELEASTNQLPRLQAGALRIRWRVGP